MADVELNSIGNGDGTNYLVRDNTKIPLTGTNALAGSIVPSADNTCDLGSSTYNFKNVYAYKLILKNSYIARTVNNDYLGLCGGTNYSSGAYFTLYGKDSTINAGAFRLRANDGTNSEDLIGKPDGTLTWGSKSVAMQEDVVPRSGGAVITGNTLGRNDNIGTLDICSGTQREHGAYIVLCGASYIHDTYAGLVRLNPYKNSSNNKGMELYPNGTWTWNGSACQITSDQRFKQQITEIDNALLDAWEDVELVQFKYNDAVEEKGNTARLHTGYVVQQIDDACKSHGVDISAYGLYCHEEYAEETREVEHEDGTKTTEVVRPANEHYSLRYTEALIVECAYLRKKNKDLQEQLNALSERLEKLENR